MCHSKPLSGNPHCVLAVLGENPVAFRAAQTSATGALRQLRPLITPELFAVQPQLAVLCVTQFSNSAPMGTEDRLWNHHVRPDIAVHQLRDPQIA